MSVVLSLIISTTQQTKMASYLCSNLTFLPVTTKTRHIKTRTDTTIRCGPRDSRGPLMKGRTLSIEAIQAVQALKRAQRLGQPVTNDGVLSKTLSRLIKADLIATFKELVRQDHCDLAVQVFSVVQSEFWYKTDLSLYADLVSLLAKNGTGDDIDKLISDLDKEGNIECDDKGLIRLIKSLIAAGRAESTLTMYRLMKKSGWGSSCAVDEYTAKVLSRGFRRLGEGIVADEIDKAYLVL